MASCGKCGISADIIEKPTFACFPESPSYVTYRATLKGTSLTKSGSLISLLEKWVSSGTATIIVTGVLLLVDNGCVVIISSLSERECSPNQPPVTNTTINPTHPSTAVYHSEDATESDVGSDDNTTAIVGGVVAVVLILAITVAFIAIVALRYLRRGLSVRNTEK